MLTRIYYFFVPFSLMVLLITLTNDSLAQAPPSIRASAHVIRIESNFPYNLDPYSPANNYPSTYGVRRSFTLYDENNVTFSSYENFNTGTFTKEFFASELKKPTKLWGYYLIDSVINEYIPDPYCQNPEWNYYCYCYTYNNNCEYVLNPLYYGTYYPFNIPSLNITYPFMDTTITDPVSNYSVRVTVNPSGDNNFNLPSQDIISIKAENYQAGYNWEYEVLDAGGNGVWTPVPANLVQNGNTEIVLNGEQLFSWNWINQLNKTVLFRLKKQTNTNGVITTTTSNILVYTHRLSSPRITSTSIVPNPCFGMDSASVNIQFNRQLMANEKLNIFLKDSITGVDFSAFNLTNADFEPGNIYKWKKELVKGAYRVSLIGKYFDMASYTGSPDHFSKANVQDPDLLKLGTNQETVLCFDGNSGSVVLKAKGGVGNYKYDIALADSSFNNNWQPFINPTYLPDGNYEYKVGGRVAKEYKVKLRDGNNCKVLDSNGVEVFKTQKVYQPATPLNMPLYVVSPITAHTATDGSITIRLAGGSPFILTPENAPTYRKYQFEWRDSATGALINNYVLDTVGKFETKIQNLAEGTYRFTAWDRNYNLMPGTNQQGCRIDFYIRMRKPDPLNVYISAISPVKCNGESNGKLKAFPSGGIPVSDTIKYNFTWYKQVSGTYVNQNVNDSILTDVGVGNYYVEIRDKNNYLKASSVFALAQPAPLATTGSTTQSSCYFTTDGSMSVATTGGTAPYRYEWSNGALTQTVPNVGGGTYFVVVKDSMLCQTTQQVIVTSPNQIITTPTITPIACNGSNTAAISLSATGGIGAFTYQWSTGATTSSINNLAPGTYWFKVKDASVCYDSASITIENPEHYTVDAGPNRKICLNQVIRLTPQISATNNPVTVQWSTPQGTKDSTSIHVSTPGTYIVSVNNSTGCSKKDTVIVTPENATVNTSFTVSTQAFAGENTTLVNISPTVQDSVKWILPQGVSYQLISSSKNFCEVKFADTGVYMVGMRAYYSNGCIDEKYKGVNVVRQQGFVNLGSQADAFLKQFSIAPNPTSGAFTLNLLFNAVTPAKVRIVNILTNVTIDTRQLVGAASYSEQYNLSSPPFTPGLYIVIIETAKGNFIHKLIKN